MCAGLDTGTIADERSTIFRSRWFTSLGVGLRIKNEHMVFDGFQLRFAYIPSGPEGLSAFDVSTGSVRELNIPDYLPRQPEIPPYN